MHRIWGTSLWLSLFGIVLSPQKAWWLWASSLAERAGGLPTKLQAPHANL